MNRFQHPREGYVTVRVYISTHAILKTLSEYENMTLVEYFDQVMREEAQRKGFEILEAQEIKQPESVVKEIVLPRR